MAKRAGLPLGSFIKVDSIRLNKSGTIDVIIPDGGKKRRNPKKKKPAKRKPVKRTKPKVTAKRKVNRSTKRRTKKLAAKKRK